MHRKQLPEHKSTAPHGSSSEQNFPSSEQTLQTEIVPESSPFESAPGNDIEDTILPFERNPHAKDANLNQISIHQAPKSTQSGASMALLDHTPSDPLVLQASSNVQASSSISPLDFTSYDSAIMSLAAPELPTSSPSAPVPSTSRGDSVGSLSAVDPGTTNPGRAHRFCHVCRHVRLPTHSLKHF